MKRLIAFIFIVIGCIACEKPYVQKPANLISKSDMIDILEELYLTQQMVNSSTSESGNHVMDLAKNSRYILEQNNTNLKDFELSYKYYFTQPSVYQKMLDKVKVNLKDRFSEEERKRFDQINNQ